MKLSVLYLLLIVVSLLPNLTLATVISADPTTYRGLLETIQPGDTLQLAAGVYTLGLPISNRHGTSEQPIIISGPETGAPAVLSGNAARNTVQIDSSSYIILRYLTMDGLEIPYVDAINSRGITHHITLEHLRIINHGGSYQPDTDHQLTVGIATRGPAWDWTIRSNVIIGAGTGIYLGNWQGRGWAFVGGLIEHNIILDTLGYNIQIKQMLNRYDSNDNSVPGMPVTDRRTVIRHNVFSKLNNASSSGTWARPNLLVGHWPLTGPGSNDVYEIYGNLFYDNPTEALFQGEGNVALYDNLLVNHSGNAVHIQQHNHKPRMIRVFHNSLVASGIGIRVRDVDLAYSQLVTGNAVFAGTPFSLDVQVQELSNISDTFNSAESYLRTPFGIPGSATLDLYPIAGGSLSGLPIDDSLLQLFNDWNIDFNGNQRQQEFRGAYADEGLNPGWQLALTIKPEAYTASQGAPDIIEEPGSLTVIEGEAASFGVRAGGSSSIQYQWFRNGEAISGATGIEYTVATVLVDDGAVYHCEVSNTLGGDVSNDAILTVLPDTTAPLIIGAVLRGSDAVDIQFNEAVTELSAEEITNYQIDQGIQVLGAALSSDMQTVRLQTDTLIPGNTYTITVSDIRDTSSNANEIVPASNVSIILEPNIDLDNGLLPAGWVPLTVSRWSVVMESGNNALFLNTTDYPPLSGNRLGEYIISPDSYSDFSLNVKAKTDESSGNANADYALVFGYQDGDNYYYMLFNRTQSNTQLFKVVEGTREVLATAAASWLSDNEYHELEIRRASDNIEVRFDDSIVLQVTDNTLVVGKLGLGSYNDSAYFDDIRISVSSNAIPDVLFTNDFE